MDEARRERQREELLVRSFRPGAVRQGAAGLATRDLTFSA
jgi:hypothetical protein